MPSQSALIARKQLGPHEEARAVAAMLADGLTEDAAAEALGWPKARVTARGKLLELPERAQSREFGVAPEMLVPSAERVSPEADRAPGSRLIQQSTDAGEAAALVLASQELCLTADGGRHSGAAGVLDRRDGRAVVAVSLGMAAGVPNRQPQSSAPVA